MYVSKKLATQLVGAGVAVTQVNQITARLNAFADSAKDLNKNGSLEDFEIRAALKSARYPDTFKTAVWSVMGTSKVDNTDGESGTMSPVTRADFKSNVKYAHDELVAMASGGKVTVDGLKGEQVAKVALKLLAAAKASRG